MEDVREIFDVIEIGKLQQQIGRFFPESEVSLETLFANLFAGNLRGALTQIFQGTVGRLSEELGGMKALFIWLLLLGVAAAAVSHFVEIFDRHQVADMGFYFLYLCAMVICFECFRRSMQVAVEAISDILLFVRMILPVYMMTVGLANGIGTLTISCQLLLLGITVVEWGIWKILLPIHYGYMYLSSVSSMWMEEKTELLLRFVEKVIRFLLKGILTICTGMGVFQNILAPVFECAGLPLFERIAKLIPGVGQITEGIIGLAFGTAVLVKRSAGVIFMLLLIAVCLVPVFKIASVGVTLKCAAAFMGLVGDRRITDCVNRTGEVCMLLLKTVVTAGMIFLLAIAMISVSVRTAG